MERRINKEVREYKENMFWGLTLRQLLCSLLGVIVSVGIYFLLKSHIGMEAVSWACILGMLPFALCGFFSYNQMTAEKLLIAIIKTEILTPKILKFKGENAYMKMLEEFKNDFEKETRKNKRKNKGAKKSSGRTSHKGYI